MKKLIIISVLLIICSSLTAQISITKMSVRYSKNEKFSKSIEFKSSVNMVKTGKKVILYWVVGQEEFKEFYTMFKEENFPNGTQYTMYNDKKGIVTIQMFNDNTVVVYDNSDVSDLNKTVKMEGTYKVNAYK